MLELGKTESRAITAIHTVTSRVAYLRNLRNLGNHKDYNQLMPCMPSKTSEGEAAKSSSGINKTSNSSEPLEPAVVEAHGKVERIPVGSMQSSRNSLFSVFRRQPRRDSRVSNRSGHSTAGSVNNESFMNAFDNMSMGQGVAQLESPKKAREASVKMKKMLKAAVEYRHAMEAVTAAADEFGSTLYDYADTKGASAGETNLPDHAVSVDVMAAGGLHLLISNHFKLLSTTLATQLEHPIQKAYEQYNKDLNSKEREFKRTLRAKMADLQEAENRRIKDAKTKSRNLDSYRNSLLDLTSQIDDINRAKFEFLGDLHTLETATAEAVHICLSTAVTAEIEVFEGLARKGWTGGGLDGLLAGGVDPFEARTSTVLDKLSIDKEDGAENNVSRSSLSNSNSTSKSALFSLIPQQLIVPKPLINESETGAATGTTPESGRDSAVETVETTVTTTTTTTTGSGHAAESALHNDNSETHDVQVSVSDVESQFALSQHTTNEPSNDFSHEKPNETNNSNNSNNSNNISTEPTNKPESTIVSKDTLPADPDLDLDLTLDPDSDLDLEPEPEN